MNTYPKITSKDAFTHKFTFMHDNVREQAHRQMYSNMMIKEITLIGAQGSW